MVILKYKLYVTKLNFIWHWHDYDLDPRRKKMICLVIISFWVCTCWRHIFLLSLLRLNWPEWCYLHWPHALLFIYLYTFWLSVIQRGLFAAPIKIRDDWICRKKYSCTTTMYMCHCKVQTSKTQIGTNVDTMYILLHWIHNNPFDSNP